MAEPRVDGGTASGASKLARVPTEFTLARRGDVAVVTIDSGDADTPPFFGEHALRSLDRVLDELERDDYAAAVFTGVGGFFAVGADITEFPNITPERAREGSRVGHELFGRVRTLPFPTVAAINGGCLGGGLELALHCTTRVIADDVRHVAFPEVFLGLFPAWGGTQLLPRLVGPANAVELIVTNPLRQNRMLRAGQAHELGAVDRVVAQSELLDAAIELAREGVARDEPDWSDAETIFRRARNDIDDQVHGAAPAPYVALDLVAGARTWTVAEGYAREEDAIAELLPGRQAQASLYAFDLVEHRLKRVRPDGEPRAVEQVGIVGAGLMARQIAALFVKRLQVPLVISDVKRETLDEAIAELDSPLVRGTTTYDAFADCDLVLEAVFEEMSVKKDVFAQLERVVGDDCILATNTSSLSVSDIATDLRATDRVVGMHFFNPVAVMPLVEIVRARETDETALATGYDVATKLRKRPIVVADTPGFVVNRVLTRMTRVIMDAIEHGTSVEDVDEAVMSLGMPMAPSVLLMMVGPRVANDVLEAMHDAFPERFPLSPTLANYAAGSDEPVIVEHAPWTRDEIVERILAAVADEIHRMIEDGVVREAADVDTCLLLGAGWPFFLGGITKHLDQIGMSERLFGHTFAEMSSRVPA